MAEGSPAVAVVQLTKFNCALERRNWRDGSAEVWKHFGYYPIEFWKKQQYAFPALSRVARKYLCIPATTACSERTFSTTGLIITEKRSRLKPDIVSTVVFLYGSWELVEEYWLKKIRRNVNKCFRKML